MILDNDGNITIITQDIASVKAFVNTIQNDYKSFKKNHLIVNVSSLSEVVLEDILHFLELSNMHRGNKKSFVIVSDKADLDTMPDEICVVPTMQEAYDIIEMEDIERDLGF